MYLRRTGLALVSTLFLLGTSIVQAETLQALEIFKRCYMRMVRQVPVESSPTYALVADGKISPEDACVNLFDLAKFGSDGILKDRTNPVGKRILKTFNDLHISWFQSKWYQARSPGTYIVRDIEEPALYFTRATFQQGVEFKSVVTHSTGLQGVRDQASYPIEINDFEAQVIYSHAKDKPYTNTIELPISYNSVDYNPTTKKFTGGALSAFIAPGLVETGALVGVKPATDIFLPSWVQQRTTDPDLRDSFLQTYKPFYANQHFGGGVLGSQSFFLANANLAVAQFPNEYTAINRRLTSRMFEDLLCHQLPTLDDADVQVISGSPHTFQNQTTCMRCHSTIDGLGTALRGMYIFTTSAPATNQDIGVPFSGVAKLAPISGATMWALQQPTGKLHYRENLTRKLVNNVPVSSLQMVGDNFASGQDLYLCAAKRYYKFFTGIDVNLTQVASGKLEKFHQEEVVRLGKSLKTSQSVRELLKAIFKSEAFRTRNYLSEKSE